MPNTPFVLTKEIAQNILDVIDKGLVSGLGQPTPGNMCVEAAVCYALNLPHDDDPKCVASAVRSFKITLNDCEWSSTAVRAKGLRRLAIAQLGTLDVIDNTQFATKLAEKIIRVLLPKILRQIATLQFLKSNKQALLVAANNCENKATAAAARAARAAVDAADAAYAAYAADAADADAGAGAAVAAARAAYAAARAAYDAAYAADAADADAGAGAAVAAAYAADAAAAAAYADAASKDKYLILSADLAVEVLRELNAPAISIMDELCNVATP